MHLSGGEAWRLESWTNLEACSSRVRSQGWISSRMKVKNDTAVCICLSEGNAGNGTEKWRVLCPTLMSAPAFMPVTCHSVKEAWWSTRSGQEADSMSSDTKQDHRVLICNRQRVEMQIQVQWCVSLHLHSFCLKFHLATALFSLINCHYQIMQITANILRTAPGTVISS